MRMPIRQRYLLVLSEMGERGERDLRRTWFERNVRVSVNRGRCGAGVRGAGVMLELGGKAYQKKVAITTPTRR